LRNVPEGRYDRSLARSAWESATSKEPSRRARSDWCRCATPIRSAWIHQTFPNLRNFAWQQGDGAFRIALSQVEERIHYIEKQLEHHRTRTFQEEYLAFLKKYGTHFDEKYLWISWARSDRTLRDGSLKDALPGTSCQATIRLSLRDGAGKHFATASRLELARHLNHGPAEAHPCEEPLRRLVAFGSRQDDARRAARLQVRLGRI
jgi:putative transposase